MSRPIRSSFWVAAAASALLLSAPALSDELAAFSHRVHVKSAGMECSACHAQTAAGVELRTGGCGECHDDGVPKWRLEPKARPLAARFPHARHAGKVECLECHRAVLTDQNTAGAPVLGFEGCARCHSLRQVPLTEASCARCHGDEARRGPPGDHRGAWLSRHGAEAQGRGIVGHGRDCRSCHGSDACARCHRERRPRSHTGLWRVRLHGSAAAWDRDSCKTCHETGTCTACHDSTRPLNHTSAWRATHGLAAGAESNERCAVCHRPSQCAACHRARGVP
jgi:hypothetical protein